MYIPRPAKRLFTVDDGWNRYLGSNGDSVSPWTRLCVERMLACGTTEMGVRRFCCSSPGCTHSRFFCQSCKSKACSACGFKATEQWVSQQSHILSDCDWQHITFTMPYLLWPFFNNNWPLLNQLFQAATRAMLRWARKQGVEVGIFCALHTYGRQLNQHPHIHVSVTRGGLSVKHGVWKNIFFKKTGWKKSGAPPSLSCCGTTMTRLIRAPCRDWGTSATKNSGCAICRRSTDADGRSTSRRKPAVPGGASNISAGT